MAGYVLISAFFWQQWFRPKAKLANPVLLASPVLVLHATLIVSGLAYRNGLDLSITNLISLVTLLIATGLTIGHRTFNSLLLLPPVYLLAAAAQLPELVQTSHYVTHLGQHTGLAVHVSLALAAYCILMVAALMAVQVWVIDYRLKQHASLSGLPPLMVVDRQLEAILKLGFAILTASIMTGSIFLEGFFGQGQGHKAILTIIAWLLYAIMLVQKFRTGVSSRRMAILSIIAAGVLTLAYFGSRFIKEVLLN